MRSSTAYLAGAGTVVIAIVAGLGGGLVIADIMSPHAPKQELSKVERRAPPEPSTSATRDPLMPVPYLAATQAASSGPVVVSPAPPSDARNSSPPASSQQPPMIQAAAPEASTAQAPAVTASNDQAAQPSDSARETVKETAKLDMSGTKSAAVQPAMLREQSAPDDADAKARDADVKRAERKKADRRQQWSDRRRTQPNREQELRDVEQQVRASTEPRDYDVRSYDERPVRVGAPQIRLFGGSDD